MLSLGKVLSSKKNKPYELLFNYDVPEDDWTIQISNFPVEDNK